MDLRKFNRRRDGIGIHVCLESKCSYELGCSSHPDVEVNIVLVYRQYDIVIINTLILAVEVYLSI